MHATARLGFRLGPRASALGVRTAVTAAQVRPYNEVPGPKPLPIIGNAWRFLPGIGTLNMEDFVVMIGDLREKYGDLVKISNIPGRGDLLFVFDPQSVEHVFRNEGAWPSRIPFQSVKYFRTKVRGDFFEDNLGLVMENGEKWQQARTVVNPPMMQPKVAKQYAHTFDQVAKDFVKRMSDLRDKKQEMPADFENELKKWALESISLVALDTRLGCLEAKLDPNSDSQRMINAVTRIFDASYELDLKPPIWKIINTAALKTFIEESNAFLEISLKHVERAREKMSDDIPEESQSVLQRILRRETNTKRAVVMAMDMMFAGVDTTGNTAAFVLYHLARNPEQQEKLYRELKEHVSTDDLTAEVIDSMKYLKACIKESIRLSPVTFGNARILQKDIVLKNFMIPKGVEIMMSNGHMYRMDEHYPEAKKFIPERWLRGDDSSKTCPGQHKTHPFVYLPFGHGPRQCVGFRLANLELETLVARVVNQFRLEWHYGDLREVSRMLNMPGDPVRIRAIDR